MLTVLGFILMLCGIGCRLWVHPYGLGAQIIVSLASLAITVLGFLLVLV